MIPPEFVVLYKIVILALLFFNVKMSTVLDFDGDCFESVNSFDKIAIFIMSILSIQEHRRSLHLLISLTVSFFKKKT